MRSSRLVQAHPQLFAAPPRRTFCTAYLLSHEPQLKPNRSLLFAPIVLYLGTAIASPAMAQSASPQLRSIYRRLLRELPTAPQTTRTQHQKLSSPSVLQKAIRSSIATPKAGPSTQGQIQQAEQFIQYVQAQRTYASLLERYNPGMGMTEEERVRLTARRVGMDLPIEYGGGKEKA